MVEILVAFGLNIVRYLIEIRFDIDRLFVL